MTYVIFKVYGFHEGMGKLHYSERDNFALECLIN